MNNILLPVIGFPFGVMLFLYLMLRVVDFVMRVKFPRWALKLTIIIESSLKIVIICAVAYSFLSRSYEYLCKMLT